MEWAILAFVILAIIVIGTITIGGARFGRVDKTDSAGIISTDNHSGKDTKSYR